MSGNEADLQSIFRIWPAHGDGAFLEVYVDGDGMVTIKTTDPQSEKYFGKVGMSFEKEVAKKLAEALKVLT